jgi:putative (di)nucleoside polyphosphate hydrolase
VESAQPKSLDLYRPNVGIVLARRDGRVWLGRRAGTTGPFNWQFPQGGVDKGESLLDAALRELKEETGATQVAFVGRTTDWMAYDFPEGYGGPKAFRGWIGQKQIWFLFRFDGEDADFDIERHPPPEFDAWRWATRQEALADIVPFKRVAYGTMLQVLGPLIDALETWEPASGADATQA